MFTQKTAAIPVFALALAMPLASSAAAASPEPCPLRQYRVGSVTPYRPLEAVGKFMVPRLRGAAVLVEAQPGLTAEWLRLSLGKEIASMPSRPGMKDCPLGVDSVTIQVDSGGTGFWIRIIAKDPRLADEVLRRANLLLGAG